MNLRAKMKLVSVCRDAGGRSIKLAASNQTDGDNKDWSKWTPGGSIELYVSNENAFGQADNAEIGQHFWVDITPIAPASQPAP